MTSPLRRRRLNAVKSFFSTVFRQRQIVTRTDSNITTTTTTTTATTTTTELGQTSSTASVTSRSNTITSQISRNESPVKRIYRFAKSAENLHRLHCNKDPLKIEFSSARRRYSVEKTSTTHHERSIGDVTRSNERNGAMCLKRFGALDQDVVRSMERIKTSREDNPVIQLRMQMKQGDPTSGSPLKAHASPRKPTNYTHHSSSTEEDIDGLPDDVILRSPPPVLKNLHNARQKQQQLINSSKKHN